MNKNFYCGVGDQSLPGCSFVQEDEGGKRLGKKERGSKEQEQSGFSLLQTCFYLLWTD